MIDFHVFWFHIPTLRIWHLLMLKGISHQLDHAENLCKSSCWLCLKLFEIIEFPFFISSVNFTMKLSSPTPMSFTYIINFKVPRTDLCRAPLVIGVHLIICKYTSIYIPGSYPSKRGSQDKALMHTCIHTHTLLSLSP